MREYSAISVSATDATSLANRLTEQARQGWALVEIVHTNDQVVAYLEREADNASSGDAGSGGSSGFGSTGAGSTGSPFQSDVTATETVTAIQDDAGNAAIVDQSTYQVGSGQFGSGTGAGSDASPGWATGGTDAGSAYTAGATQSAHDAATSAHDQSSNAVDSAASSVGGYGDSASAAVASAAGSAGGAVDAGQHGGHQAAAGQTGTAPGGVGYGAAGESTGQSQDHTPASGTSGDSGLSGGLAPAGWYTDPAGRFELRYWDGTQWTEHVASGSEQAIDPPVKG